MTGPDPITWSESIRGAAAAAYLAAEKRLDGVRNPVAPLRDLVAAYPLTVEEVPALTRRSAAAHMLARVGKEVVEPASDGEQLSGFLYASALGNTRFGFILVNTGDPLVRRRFSIAHELGHYLLHFESSLPAVVTDALEFREELATVDDDAALSSGQTRFSSDEQNDQQLTADPARMEQEADQFAAEVLMPASVCRRLVEERWVRAGGRRTVMARLLATEMLVSHAAMERRLADLKLF